MATKTKLSTFAEAMQDAARVKRSLLALEGSHPRLSVAGWQQAVGKMFDVRRDEVTRLQALLATASSNEHQDIQRTRNAIRREISNGNLRRPVSASGTKQAQAYFRTLGGAEAVTALHVLGFSFAALFFVALELAIEMTPGAFGTLASWEEYEREVQTLRDRLQVLLTVRPTMDDVQMDVRPDGSTSASYALTEGTVPYRPQDGTNVDAVVNYLMQAR